MLAQLPRFLTVPNLMFLLQAVGTTFALTAVGCGGGAVGGFALALLRRSRVKLVRGVAQAYVGVFRRVPFLVTLLLVFYATQIAGLDLPLFAIAALSIGLIATAYIAEIVRAGLDSVHPNQWDSAAIANLSAWQTLRYVVLPQAWRVILPPAFGFFLLFVKDSALASQIGVPELAFAGRALNNRGFAPSLAWGSVLVLYFALSYPLARLGQALEARLARPRHH